MAAGPIWQPPDGFGGDAQERMRVNQLRALYGLSPAEMQQTAQQQQQGSPGQKFNEGRDWLYDKAASLILGKPADLSRPAYTSPSVAAPGYRPPWGGPLNIGPTTPPAYHPAAAQTDAALQRAAETSGGLGMLLGGVGAGGPEGMTPGNVAANLGIAGLQAVTPQHDGQQAILYPAYHGTNKAFDEYDPSLSQDLGIHFGTLEQAQNRIGFTKGAFDKEKVYQTGANIRPVNVDMDNPVTLPDIFSMGGMMIDTAHEFMRQPQLWFEPEDAAEFEHTASMIDHLEEKAANTQPGMQGTDWNGFTTADRAMHKAYKRAFWNILERTVRDNGYDGVIYSNRAEGPGDSYIAFDPRQVTPRFGGPQPEPQQTVHDPLAKLLFKIKDDLKEPPPPSKGPLSLPESIFDYDDHIVPMKSKAEFLTGKASPLQFNSDRGYQLHNAADTMDFYKQKALGFKMAPDKAPQPPEEFWGAHLPDHQLINYSPHLTDYEKQEYGKAKAMYNKTIGATMNENGYDGLELVPMEQEHLTPWPPQEPQTPIKLQDDPWGFMGPPFAPWEKHLPKFDER